MNILQELIKSQNGQVVDQLASQFGVSQAEAQAALSNLIPAISRGVKKTASSQSGLEELLSKVATNRDLRGAVENPGVLSQSQSQDVGNEILGQIFGSKDVSRQVASQSAQSTGLDVSMLKKMLPLVAGLVMSSLNKKGESQGTDLGGLLGSLAGAQNASRGGLGGLLGGLLGGGRRAAKQQKQTRAGLESFLDMDGDGSVADDVAELARKLF